MTHKKTRDLNVDVPTPQVEQCSSCQVVRLGFPTDQVSCLAIAPPAPQSALPQNQGQSAV